MIPNVIHFIFGFAHDFGGKPFSLVHYLAIKSAHMVNSPERINFYCQYEPEGEWWEKAKPYVNVIFVTPPTEIFGIPLHHIAHQTDVLRLQVLIEQGGDLSGYRYYMCTAIHTTTDRFCGNGATRCWK